MDLTMHEPKGNIDVFDKEEVEEEGENVIMIRRYNTTQKGKSIASGSTSCTKISEMGRGYMIGQWYFAEKGCEDVSICDP